MRAPELGAAFAALAVELGREPARSSADPGAFALAAVAAAFDAAAALPGWAPVGAWRFASSVSGGRLIAANTISPFLVVGKRRFMPLRRPTSFISLHCSEPCRQGLRGLA